MAEIAPVESVNASAAQPGSIGQTATSAFGLGFEDLLRIVLTQLTYQDPLKPIDNFEFVSQLAQFSQIQQTQTMSDRVLGILQAQATAQAMGVLGKTVEIPAGELTIKGRVMAVSFQSGEPRLTVKTSDDRTLSGVALSTVTQISTEN